MQDQEDKEVYAILEKALKEGTLLDIIADFLAGQADPEIIINGQAVALAPVGPGGLGGLGGVVVDKSCYKNCFKKCLKSPDHDKCYKNCTKACKPKATINITIV